jgi:hypothetical protein
MQLQNMTLIQVENSSAMLHVISDQSCDECAVLVANLYVEHEQQIVALPKNILRCAIPVQAGNAMTCLTSLNYYYQRCRFTRPEASGETPFARERSNFVHTMQAKPINHTTGSRTPYSNSESTTGPSRMKIAHPLSSRGNLLNEPQLRWTSLRG